MLEVMLSIALIAVLAGISIPVYRSFQTRNDADIAANVAVSSLRRAQALASAVDGDISWGVYAQSGSITLFKGTDYALRDTAYDETFAIPDNISVLGLTEIVFSKFTGIPESVGVLRFVSVDNDARNIDINAKGTISY